MIICKHAVEKGGRTYLTIGADGNPRSFHTVEFRGNILQLEKMVINGSFQLSRKPRTSLEKRLYEAGDKMHLVKELSLIRDGSKEETAATLQRAIRWIEEH